MKLDAKSTQFLNDLTEISEILDKSKDMALSTKLEVTKRDKTFIGYIKYLIYKYLRINISLTRSECVAKSLADFVVKNPALFQGPENLFNAYQYRKFVAKVLNLDIDAVTGDAVEDDDVNHKPLYKIFNACLNKEYLKCNLLDVQILEVKRKKNVTLDNEVIPADNNPVECVIFPGLDPSCCALGIVPPNSEGATPILIKKGKGNQIVFVNIEELAKRLYLTDVDALKQIASQGALKKYLNDRKVIQTTGLISKNVKRLLGKKGNIIKSDRLKSALTSVELMTLVHAAFRHRIEPGQKKNGVWLRKSQDERLDAVLKKLGVDEIVASFSLDKICFADPKKSIDKLVKENVDRILKKTEDLGKKPKYKLTRELLTPLVHAAFRHRNDYYAQNKHGLWLHDLKDKAVNEAISTLGIKKIVAGFRGNKIYLRDHTAQRMIGGGTEATVICVKAIPSRNDKVAKVFNTNSEAAICQLNNERHILKGLHKENPFKSKKYAPGLIKPTHGAVISEANSPVLLLTKYHASLCSALSLPEKKDLELDDDHLQIKGVFESMSVNDRLLLFYEFILSFQYFVNKKGLVHGDIKPENILVSKATKIEKDKKTGKEIKTEKVSLYLADLTGAHLYNTDRVEELPEYVVFTPLYANRGDKDIRSRMQRKLIENKSNERLMKLLWETYVEHERSMDIFALGCVLSDIMAPSRKSNANDFDQKALDDANTPGKVIALIEDIMTWKSDEWRERPAIDDLVKKLQVILVNLGIPIPKLV